MPKRRSQSPPQPNPEGLDKPAAFLKRLEDGCSRCEFDEAEGGLICHCHECLVAVATMAYSLFVVQRRRIGWPQRRRRI